VPTVALMVAVITAVTAFVVMVKLADEDPAEIVTLVGNVALVLLDERVTLRPPLGATPLTLTEPVTWFPPTTELGDTETPVSDTAWIVNVAD